MNKYCEIFCLKTHTKHQSFMVLHLAKDLPKDFEREMSYDLKLTTDLSTEQKRE